MTILRRCVGNDGNGIHPQICRRADTAGCKTIIFPDVYVWGKHSAWLSSPTLSPALLVTTMGGSPNPLTYFFFTDLLFLYGKKK